MAVPARKYAPIWETLKVQDTVCLKIHDPIYVARVKKAVIKEKHQDIPFRLLNTMREYRIYSVYDAETQILTLRLVQRFGVTMKKVV